MALSNSAILDILAKYDIHPYEDSAKDVEPPGIGEIHDGESVYSTSLDEVFGDGIDLEIGDGDSDLKDPRLQEMWERIKRLFQEFTVGRPSGGRRRDTRAAPPEPGCAWYCPIHFFGYDWGIYIRESCILSHAVDIASFVDWHLVRLSPGKLIRDLLRSAFHALFLHEQFHHKVESLGFRLMVSTGTERYRPYKRNVYRRTFLTPNCLEESLANPESFRRLDEPRYVRRVDPAIRAGLRRFVKDPISRQPPGYQEGVGIPFVPPASADIVDGWRS